MLKNLFLVIIDCLKFWQLLFIINGFEDIAPDKIDISILVDGEKSPLVNINKVYEYGGTHKMTAYLIQIATKKVESWHKLDVEIWDENQNYGAASIFNEL